jgi:hypothetical protein
MPGVISVFLTAPMDIRMERVKSYFHCDDKRAHQIIEQGDHDRIGFHRFFFDMDWKDPANYHLCLNTGYLPPSLCAVIIKDLRNHAVNTETETQNNRRLKEMTLGQQLIHHILYEKEIPIHFLEASVTGETATLYGVAKAQALVEAAVSAAREMGSVKSVISEIQVVKEYSVMP